MSLILWQAAQYDNLQEQDSCLLRALAVCAELGVYRTLHAADLKYK